jgi:hypothetical protein
VSFVVSFVAVAVMTSSPGKVWSNVKLNAASPLASVVTTVSPVTGSRNDLPSPCGRFTSPSLQSSFEKNRSVKLVDGVLLSVPSMVS